MGLHASPTELNGPNRRRTAEKYQWRVLLFPNGGTGAWPDRPRTRNERAEALPFNDAIRLAHGRQGWLPLALRPPSRPGLWGFISFADRPGAGHYPPSPMIACANWTRLLADPSRFGRTTSQPTVNRDCVDTRPVSVQH